MRRMIALGVLALAIGCAKSPPKPAPPPPEPEAAPDPFFVHTVTRDGETLGEIAKWYTGKYGNWLILTKPVNPDLEKCCTPLKAGREVKIPRHLVVREDPLPEPTKPPARSAKAPKAGAAPSGEDAAPSAKPVGEAPSGDDEAPAATPIAEAPASKKAPAEAAAAAGAASGTVKMRGSSWKVVDAIAFPDGDDTHVVVSSARFDRKEIAKDGKVDDSDAIDLQMNAHASTLTIKIGKDGTVNCVDYSLPTGGGSSCGTAPSEGWKAGKRSASSVAGKLAYQDGDDKVDVRFDVPVTREVKRAGTPLPAGGGEPGKALIERFAANRSGDFEKIKAVTPPSKRKEMDATPAEDRKMALDFMKLSTPAEVKIVGGTIDGDSAQIDFEGKDEGGTKITGTAEAIREDGKWYVGSVSSRQ